MRQQVTYEVAMKHLNARYYGIYMRALKRGLEFNISLYDLHEILSQPCDYCGSEESGIDRKDNSQGYIPSNITSCCKRCNTLKGDNYDYLEMKELGQEIREYDMELY